VATTGSSRLKTPMRSWKSHYKSNHLQSNSNYHRLTCCQLRYVLEPWKSRHQALFRLQINGLRTNECYKFYNNHFKDLKIINKLTTTTLTPKCGDDNATDPGPFSSYDWITVENICPKVNSQHWKISNIECPRHNNVCQFRGIDLLMPEVRIYC
jgi:hypothetical protein